MKIHPSHHSQITAPVNNDALPSGELETTNAEVPKITPISYHIPILLLLVILIITILLLVFHRRSSQRKQRKRIAEQKKRGFDAKLDANLEKQPDLLGSTVFTYDYFSLLTRAFAKCITVRYRKYKCDRCIQSTCSIA